MSWEKRFATALKKISVLHYRDYRDYLVALYQYMKDHEADYSYRIFATQLGFKASNYFHLIINRKRNLSLKTVQQVAIALTLNEKEEKHFRNMVALDHADEGLVRHKLVREVVNKGGKPGVKQIEKRKYRYFSHWYYPAIREMIELDGFVEDHSRIAKELKPNITKAEVSKALKTLLDLGLIARDDAGILRVVDKQVSTPKAVRGAFVKSYHQEMLARAADALDLTAAKDREVVAVTFGIDRETSNQIKIAVGDFWQSLQKIADQSPKGTRVMQLTMQWFPLTRDLDEPDNSGGNGQNENVQSKNVQSKNVQSKNDKGENNE